MADRLIGKIDLSPDAFKRFAIESILEDSSEKSIKAKKQELFGRLISEKIEEIALPYTVCKFGFSKYKDARDEKLVTIAVASMEIIKMDKDLRIEPARAKVKNAGT